MVDYLNGENGNHVAHEGYINRTQAQLFESRSQSNGALDFGRAQPTILSATAQKILSALDTDIPRDRDRLIEAFNGLGWGLLYESDEIT